MSTFETELERQLDNLAEGADVTGETRVLRGVTRVHRNRRRAKTAALAAGIAVAAGAVVGMNATGFLGGHDSAGTTTPRADNAHDRPLRPSISPHDGIVRPKEPGEPCDRAKHARSPEALQQQTRVPVWTPASGKFTDAWTCGSTPVLLYDEGIQLSYQQGWDNVDVETKWARLVKSDGGRIETVLGRPAYVHPSDARGPRNGVAVVVDGTAIVTVSKPGIPIERLIELTNSIELPPEHRR